VAHIPLTKLSSSCVFTIALATFSLLIIGFHSLLASLTRNRIVLLSTA